jgi:hypothetical protein
MIKVYYNSLGSCDWVIVKNGEETIFEGHSITPYDFVDVLNHLAGSNYLDAELIEVEDVMEVDE